MSTGLADSALTSTLDPYAHETRTQKSARDNLST